MKNKVRVDVEGLSPLEVYQLVLDGTLRRFPYGYVSAPNMKEILRYVVLEKLSMSREDICKNLSYVFLRKYKLGGSRLAFDASIFKLITYCFPEFDIRYWELNKVEDAFWEKEENRKEFMLWVAEKENIHLDSLADLRKFDVELIQKYGGNRARKFAGMYNLITLVAEIDVKEWQVIKMPVWNEEKAKASVKWLIEEKLRWTKKQVENNLSSKVFYDNDLGGMLKNYCNNSPIKALRLAYSNEKFKLKNSKS